jgi:transcriptional regulator
MYDYPHYKEHDREKIIDFMRAHPFITLIGCTNNNRIEVTQLPVLIEEKERKIFLHGHMARKSDHHKALEENSNVLALFTGPHSYVSGTWYAGNPQQASTWNYISVHARGRLSFLGEEELIGLLKRLSLHFENGNVNSSTVYDNLPDEYKSKLVKAIVAFEIEVTELENVFKLSQNRDEKSYDNIIAELKKQEGDAKLIAEIMEVRKHGVFEK